MRLALISDIHEDYQNLKRVLKKATEKAYDRLICLGDISGFSLPYFSYRNSRDSSACLKLLREQDALIIPGNHDLHAIGSIPRQSDVFSFPANWYEMSKSERTRCSNGRLWLHDEDLDYGFSHEDLLFLRELPEYQILETDSKKLLLSHYAYPNLSGFSQGFYSREQEFKAHFSFMHALECSLSFTGHAHPRGFYCVTPRRFRQYGYRKITMPELPAIVSIPPVTRYLHRTGFCIYDTETDSLHTYKLMSATFKKFLHLRPGGY